MPSFAAITKAKANWQLFRGQELIKRYIWCYSLGLVHILYMVTQRCGRKILKSVRAVHPSRVWQRHIGGGLPRPQDPGGAGGGVGGGGQQERWVLEPRPTGTHRNPNFYKLCYNSYQLTCWFKVHWIYLWVDECIPDVKLRPLQSALWSHTEERNIYHHFLSPLLNFSCLWLSQNQPNEPHQDAFKCNFPSKL